LARAAVLDVEKDRLAAPVLGRYGSRTRSGVLRVRASVLIRQIRTMEGLGGWRRRLGFEGLLLGQQEEPLVKPGHLLLPEAGQTAGDADRLPHSGRPEDAVGADRRTSAPPFGGL
jgi:hypothetical protein